MGTHVICFHLVIIILCYLHSHLYLTLQYLFSDHFIWQSCHMHLHCTLVFSFLLFHFIYYFFTLHFHYTLYFETTPTFLPPIVHLCTFINALTNIIYGNFQLPLPFHFVIYIYNLTITLIGLLVITPFYPPKSHYGYCGCPLQVLVPALPPPGGCQ